MNAAGLRDQPLRVYRRVDLGKDGITKAVFLFTAWWWGRLDESSAHVAVMQQRLQMDINAVAEFADEAVMYENGVLVDETTNRAWWIRGYNSNRLLRRMTVGLERVNDEQFRLFQVFNSQSDLDGAHLVDGA